MKSKEVIEAVSFNCRLINCAMRVFNTIVLLFLCGTGLCQVQDTTIVISAKMPDKDFEQLHLARLNGWIFRQGNDSIWAGKTIDNTGWQRMKPTELSVKNADSTGKAEGWFRLNIRLDSSFENKPVGLRVSTWAACDVYLDGKFIASFGSTGAAGAPYAEHKPFNEAAVPVHMAPGSDYTLALHVVDYVTALPTPRLKSQAMGLQLLIRLTGPQYNTRVLRGNKELVTYDLLWISVSAALSLLFWLLAIQNPQEKNLRLIAAHCTALA